MFNQINIVIIGIICLNFTFSNTSEASTFEKSAQQVVNELQTRLLASKDIAGDEEKLSLMYEGCYKNPAGKDLSAPEKQLYCSIPLSFRICYTPKVLLATEEANLMEIFKACESTTGENYSDIENFETVFETIFINQDLSQLSDGFLFENVPILTDREFFTIALKTFGTMIQTKERQFYIAYRKTLPPPKLPD